MKRGFTLIELVMVIVILGILAAVAVPTFFNLQDSAKQAACKGALGGLRSGIAIWYAKSATGGTAGFPAQSNMTATDTTNGVMVNGSIPPNPYVTVAADATVITSATATTKYTVSGAGWVYSSVNGSIWGATTDSSTF